MPRGPRLAQPVADNAIGRYRIQIAARRLTNSLSNPNCVRAAACDSRNSRAGAIVFLLSLTAVNDVTVQLSTDAKSADEGRS